MHGFVRPMRMGRVSLLWIVQSIGWNEGALAALWAADVLQEAGIRVTVQPLEVETNPPLPWPKAVERRPPLSQQRRKEWENLFVNFDCIIVDQNFDTELQYVKIARDLARTFLFARQPSLPEPVDVSQYARFDGVLTVGRPSYQALASQPALLPSRLFPVPLLVGKTTGEIDSWPFSPADGPVIVMAGIVDAFQGIEIIVNALSVMTARNQSYAFLVLGDGPEAKRLKAYTRSLGVRADFVPEALGWREWVAKADVLVTLGFNPGLMADVEVGSLTGTPVLAPDILPVRDRADQVSTVWLEKPTVMAVVEQLERGQKWSRGIPKTPNGRIDEWMAALKL